jgi:hypothetical protein
MLGASDYSALQRLYRNRAHRHLGPGPAHQRTPAETRRTCPGTKLASIRQLAEQILDWSQVAEPVEIRLVIT